MKARLQELQAKLEASERNARQREREKTASAEGACDSPEGISDGESMNRELHSLVDGDVPCDDSSLFTQEIYKAIPTAATHAFSDSHASLPKEQPNQNRHSFDKIALDCVHLTKKLQSNCNNHDEISNPPPLESDAKTSR